MICSQGEEYEKISSVKNSKRPGKNVKSAADYNVMSVDKVDPNKGYTKDNIVFCCNAVNMFKAHHNFKNLEPIIKGLYEKIKKEKK